MTDIYNFLVITESGKNDIAGVALHIQRRSQIVQAPDNLAAFASARRLNADNYPLHFGHKADYSCIIDVKKLSEWSQFLIEYKTIDEYGWHRLDNGEGEYSLQQMAEITIKRLKFEDIHKRFAFRVVEKKLCETHRVL